MNGLWRMLVTQLTGFFLSLARAFSIALGAWLAALLPVQFWVDARRATNEVTGHVPNMDPGVILTLAFFITVPIIAITLVVEIVRRWGLHQKPLSLLSCFVLGILAAWPVGYSFAMPASRFGHKEIFLVYAFGIILFYTIRWLWQKRRK